MSEFKVEVVKIENIEKHPDADTLSITTACGFPVVFRTTDFKLGDKAAYIPVDAICPDTPEFAFLGGKTRIKAKKLRGVFSMGMLVSAKLEWEPGQDVAQELGIVKWEEVMPTHMGTENEKDPGFMPKYDVEPYLKYKHYLEPNEEVLVTEKLHGANGRWGYKDGRLWVGSHNCIKKENDLNLWWKVANQHNLKQLLSFHPGYVFYGEVYGWVQDIRYDCKVNEYKLAIFDIFDSNQGRWLDVDKRLTFCNTIGLPHVPVLYRGPMVSGVVEPLASGKSAIANNIREGIVIEPVKVSYKHSMRVKLKLVSEEYHLRKGGTEFH